MNIIELFEGENQFKSYPSAICFNNWTSFQQKLALVIKQGFSTEQELCSLMNIDYNLFDRIITNSIEKWRDSTSTSLLHSIAHLNGLPKVGQQIFPSLKWQTRFVIILARIYPISNQRIIDKKQFIRISNEYAQTADETKVNEIIQIIYLYYFFLKHKVIKKLPKFIYRGIRVRDLFDNLKDLLAPVWNSDKPHEMRRKEAIDIIIQYILENGLDEITDGKILSFTALLPVAKYFSRGEGIVLKIDPKTVEVITSEIHDTERVGGVDPFNGKQEKEYIVRVPEDYPWTKDNIIINDEDYFVAEQNPLAVALFGHNDKEATYKMNGLGIKARFSWNSSGTNGSVRFCLKDDYFHQTRAEFKKQYGFDPLPSSDNRDQITDFYIKKVKTW